VLVDPADAATATGYPPIDTRAFFRGRCLALWPERVVAANWDSMVFDGGGEVLRRVPMMEPSRGTKEHVGTLLETCGSVEELLDRLSA
jgi:proteasome accessory factor A